MRNSRQINFPENEFITKNKTIVTYSLVLITFLISIVFIDFYVLPKTKINDVITQYAVRSMGGRNGRSKTPVAYNYFTQKGYTFSTEKHHIEEDNVQIEYSLLLKSVTSVKAKDKNYTSSLVNGLNGVLRYFCFVLLFSIAVSLKILLSKKAFTENTFYNIICFNSFMLFISIYMMYLY